MSTRDKYEYGAAPAEDEERMEWNTLAAQLEASDVHVVSLGPAPLVSLRALTR